MRWVPIAYVTKAAPFLGASFGGRCDLIAGGRDCGPSATEIGASPAPLYAGKKQSWRGSVGKQKSFFLALFFEAIAGEGEEALS